MQYFSFKGELTFAFVLVATENGLSTSPLPPKKKQREEKRSLYKNTTVVINWLPYPGNYFLNIYNQNTIDQKKSNIKTTNLVKYHNSELGDILPFFNIIGVCEVYCWVHSYN